MSEGTNIPGTWTNEGDFIPADGSPILRHDPNPTVEPELTLAEQVAALTDTVAEMRRELDELKRGVQTLEQRMGEDSEAWRR